MSRTCTVCNHASLSAIDAALVSNEPYRSVAERFGLEKQAVGRHKREHLSVVLVKAAERSKEEVGDDLLVQVRDMIPRVLGCLAAVEREKDWKSTDRFMTQFRSFSELVLKVEGRLQAGGVNVNVGVGMASPAAASDAPPEFTAWQLGDLLASLPREQLREALAIAQQIHADNEAAEAIADNAVRPAQALTAPANLSGLEQAPIEHTHSSKLVPAGATPAQSRFQPGRMPWET